jgi:hypothetical protein
MHFVFMGLYASRFKRRFFLKRINQLIFVMVKGGVLCEVRPGLLSTIWTSFGLKGLSSPCPPSVHSHVYNSRKLQRIFMKFSTGVMPLEVSRKSHVLISYNQ